MAPLLLGSAAHGYNVAIGRKTRKRKVHKPPVFNWHRPPVPVSTYRRSRGSVWAARAGLASDSQLQADLSRPHRPLQPRLKEFGVAATPRNVWQWEMHQPPAGVNSRLCCEPHTAEWPGLPWPQGREQRKDFSKAAMYPTPPPTAMPIGRCFPVFSWASGLLSSVLLH